MVENNVSRYKILKDLDDETKRVYVNELTAYIYENSYLNMIFPIFLSCYILFLAFNLAHYFLEKKKIFESNLEEAKIKQHLIRYFMSTWLCGIKNHSKKREKKKRKKWKKKTKKILMSIWQFFFSKDKAELAFDKIHKQCKLNQLELHS